MNLLSADEVNLALGEHVRIEASLQATTGAGARDPRVLLNETAHRLDGRPLSEFDQRHTFNTYDGQNAATGPDWYALYFGSPTTFNCVEMTTGLPYRDGGWWTTLAVEVRADGADWRPVHNLGITPAYNFDDAHCERRPYETYALTFDPVAATAVRLIGRPGGLAQFTSLARLAVFHRDFRRWSARSLPKPPTPRLFRLITPQTAWDLSENLARLTGLTISLPFVEYYLDEPRYQQHWRRIQRNYQGEPELWFLLGEVLGWDTWNCREVIPADPRHVASDEPHVRLSFNQTLATAAAPVVVDGEVLSVMETHPAILKDALDWDWHRGYAREHDLSWSAYSAAIQRSPHMTFEQLEAAAALMGTIANTVANLVHHNLLLQRELDGVRSAAQRRAHYRMEIVRQAIDFMRENLETPVTVAEVAQAVALAPSHFSTLFTEQTGRNPSDFLIELRLERAKEFFANTDMSVLDVCVALGYTPSYFSRLFKRQTGASPGEYARRLRMDPRSS